VNNNSSTLNSSDPRISGVVTNKVAHITIDRAEKMNSLDASMITALGELCQQLERDDSIRAVILTGSGSKSFCAGGDIDAWSGESAEAFGRFWIREGHLVFERIARLKQPLIAVLNGHTLGGGLELAACADYRIAESQLELGLVDQVCSTGEGMATADKMAQAVAARSPRATELTKMLINSAEGEETGRVIEAMAGAIAADSTELVEGLNAYREKRKPDF